MASNMASLLNLSTFLLVTAFRSLLTAEEIVRNISARFWCFEAYRNGVSDMPGRFHSSCKSLERTTAEHRLRLFVARFLELLALISNTTFAHAHDTGEWSDGRKAI